MPEPRPPVLLDDTGQHRFERRIAERVPGIDASAWALFTFTLGAGRRAESILADVARPYGLDGSQFSVLLVLWLQEPPHRLSPTMLSRFIAQSPSGMTHTVKRLTASGFVERVGLASDGRAKHVQLTGEGVRVVGDCAAVLAKVVAETFADLDADALAPSHRHVASALAMRDLGINP